LKMLQDVGTQTNIISSDDRPMSLPSLEKLGPRTPENRSVKLPYPIKSHGENMLNRQ